MRRLLLLGCALPACLDTTLAPFGEARISVDVDLPVPRVINHLRVDVYTADGRTWFESREFLLASPASWPATFGVHAPGGARRALVRLRAYTGSAVRDYRGERFAPRPATSANLGAIARSPVTDGPRLVVGGLDRTPSLEPEPLATVDRLLRFEIDPARARSVHVVLRGVCAGTMADIARGETCVDAEDVRVPADVELEALSEPRASVVGTFGAERSCAGAPRAPSPLRDEEVCVPGGAFVMGARETTIAGADDALYPQRIAVLPPFYLDKYEVSVARYRAALGAGFVGLVSSYGKPFNPAEPNGGCTYSPTDRGREDWPLTCVPPFTAREFCAFHGGHLLRESEYEMATQVAGRPQKTRYAWGDDDPTCARAVWGRDPVSLDPSRRACISQGVGPFSVAARDDPAGDVALGSGAVNLMAGVAEITSDAYVSFQSNCWARAGVVSPVCESPDAPVSVRAGSWRISIEEVRASRRFPLPASAFSTEAGFRCARDAE